ncbi:hypothetical protein LN042_24295 [Kitasatospora sp. RB6PN24]|uniref:hypothetical protein n=1 Tax=Kitasatospora humi TaxID=2893891 RepID=UPI001E494E14|nr:hypothetical protein [Kitasatospora humi]MCC9310151.1 hypothetical protein [Kitasatospora humi]
MSDVLPDLIVLGALLAVAAVLTRLRGAVRRRGSAASALQGALTAYEHAVRVTSYEAHQEIRAQAQRQVPVLSPDDPRWNGLAVLRGAGARPARLRPVARLRRWWRR